MKPDNSGEVGLVKAGDLDFVKDLIEDLAADPVTAEPPAPPLRPRSKRQQNRDERIERINLRREAQKQDVGYLPKGFVLCGLPFKPVKNSNYYVRTNGEYILEITGSPKYGLPFGGDILPVIWVATVARRLMLETNSSKCPREISFKSGADILRAFGLTRDGKSYRLMQERIMRVFHATYFYGRAGKGRIANYSFTLKTPALTAPHTGLVNTFFLKKTKRTQKPETSSPSS